MERTEIHELLKRRRLSSPSEFIWHDWKGRGGFLAVLLSPGRTRHRFRAQHLEGSRRLARMSEKPFPTLHLEGELGKLVIGCDWVDSQLSFSCGSGRS